MLNPRTHKICFDDRLLLYRIVYTTSEYSICVILYLV